MHRIHDEKDYNQFYHQQVAAVSVHVHEIVTVSHYKFESRMFWENQTNCNSINKHYHLASGESSY